MSVPFADTFRDRRVLVTGHTGFKGSWLALWLHRLGAKVGGYAPASGDELSNFNAASVRDVLDASFVGDIRDGAALAQAASTFDPDLILHLAAQPIVRRSYADPRETFEVNVIGAASVLDAIRARNKPCAVVMVASDKCYENLEQEWGYRENDPLGGFDPYSASKGAAEIVVASYRRSFFHPDKLVQHGVKIASARAGNVIGGGDWAKDRILVDAALALANGTPIKVRSPNAIRPWQHVLDSLGGYLLLASRLLTSDNPRLCGPWNFGPAPGDEFPVRKLVEEFIAGWGAGSWDDVSDPKQPHEAGVLRLCIDKSMTRLGWRPRWGAQEAVRRAARWYRRFYSGDRDARAACLDDIADFESAC